ncbi:g666 [Coccomyxa viridis]|uniref:G666 protein n=1 Tax=Coccomyxa viridis TaxID=1274662 RepID=A0ABP1FG90_9CHLO
MTAEIYKQCCDHGVTWEGTTHGKVGKIGGLDAYFAEPKSTPKAGVMLIHDIHGWDKKNIRLVADKYADAGIAATVPDFYHGKELPADKSKIMEFIGMFPVDKSFKEVKEVMAEFKSKYSLSKVGAQGFCWGGKYTVLLLGSSDADAGVVCHGSLLNDEDVEAIKNPVLFLYSANDQQIPDEKREKFQSILKTKSFPAEGVYYPDQAHGWTLRGDDQDPKVGDAAKDAFARALKWFQQHL